MDTYTIIAEDSNGNRLGSIKIKAKNHIQHIYSETRLLGVSKSGAKRLRRFQKACAGARFITDATKYNPRLVGWTENDNFEE